MATTPHSSGADLARAPVRSQQRSRRWLGPDAAIGYLLIVPLLAIMLGLLAYPVVSALLLSFQDKKIGTPGVFVGLANYTELLTKDTRYWTVVRNSFVFTFFSIVGKVILGMLLAIVLNQQFKARSLVRAWLLLPWIAPSLVTTLTWRWMLDGSTGIINFVLMNLHLIKNPIAWLGSGTPAMGSIIAVDIWRGFPFFAVTLLAGMQAIPSELYEAAAVDGATRWHRFRFITIPGLRTVILIVTLLSTIWTFNEFQIVYVLTGGGPDFATQIFATYTFNLGFQASRLGYAVAVSVTLVPILVAIILLLAPLMLRGEDE
ncbi:MAG: carbohydrate ABC transporter permease [Thermomicrobiales bacterium]